MAVHGAVRGTGAFAVTPSDSVNLTKLAEALWIGGAGSGSLKVTTKDNSVVTFTGVPVGWFDRVIVKRVWATGTDVTGIIGIN